MSKLGKANKDIVYCMCNEKECSNTSNCEKHMKRYNFSKDIDYYFSRFNPSQCLKERLGLV